MTDNEIIANEILCIRRRASGRCNGGTDCNTCDLLMNETEIIKAYQRAMKQNDLINRLQDEKQALINGQETLQNTIVEQKAEIERLKNNIDGLNIFTTNHMKIIRLQAVKEFAERLKEKKYKSCDWSHGEHPYVVEECDIDNLVKEMTEVSE